MFYGVVHSTPRLNALLDPDEFDDEQTDIIMDLKKRKRKDRTILATVRKGITRALPVLYTFTFFRYMIPAYINPIHF